MKKALINIAIMWVIRLVATTLLYFLFRLVFYGIEDVYYSGYFIGLFLGIAVVNLEEHLYPLIKIKINLRNER